ncbi:MAG TPA: M1 family aminopeptidase [Acidobacteriaceae bacterium]|nr:M1 family aminopeptidase [Acidobacteriaceae bacterium]
MHAQRPASLAPGTGVSRELARSRAARVSDLHYSIEFILERGARQTHGTETLTFQLADASTDLRLDFRDGTLEQVVLNGRALAPEIKDGHLLLPSRRLRQGEDTVTFRFTARVGTAGAAITRYADKQDGSEYLYSLFVPMDASMAFPCFDQPDLKGSFTLTVDAPTQWTIISNTTPVQETGSGTVSQTVFAETKPIPTYLFAFAAGPWVRVHHSPGLPDVYVRRSQVNRAEPEVPELQTITQQGMTWLADYFHQPFPFPKYDMVLIPGFPFGGMEHAGATFLREDAILFRQAPTAADRFGRDITTLHELTHQWFGDLVTMRWFDDLWLKEGFAQYMAYRTMDALHPETDPWKHFFEDIKPQAYAIDETEGTTPIFQDIPNLKDAKSAYGAIVYQKAPAILKQLEFRIGPGAFRRGLEIYLAQHAYGDAEWADLIAALHTASGQDVKSWADAWVLRRGMPEVTAAFACKGGELIGLSLHQQDVLPDKFIWPMRTKLLLRRDANDVHGQTIDATLDTADATIPIPAHTACPAFVYVNAGDYAYGRFLLDPKSASYLAPADKTNERDVPLTQIREPFLRSQLMTALWENVRKADLSPSRYAQLALLDLDDEQDESISRILGGHLTTAFHAYISPTGASDLRTAAYETTRRRMLEARTPGLRIVSFRNFVGLADSPKAQTDLADLLSGKLSIPGLDFRPLDRWNMVGKLISSGAAFAGDAFAAQQKADQSSDGLKYAWAVQAGRPHAQTKQEYFEAYTLSPKDLAAKPEDWLTQSLRPFNAWNQQELTEPFLRRALDQLPEIKRDRKIFFLGVWLEAFLDGQTSETALDEVHVWLAQPDIDPDLRRKVLENTDELERTVRIRKRFGE